MQAPKRRVGGTTGFPALPYAYLISAYAHAFKRLSTSSAPLLCQCQLFSLSPPLPRPAPSTLPPPSAKRLSLFPFRISHTFLAEIRQEKKAEMIKRAEQIFERMLINVFLASSQFFFYLLSINLALPLAILLSLFRSLRLFFLVSCSSLLLLPPSSAFLIHHQNFHFGHFSRLNGKDITPDINVLNARFNVYCFANDLETSPPLPHSFFLYETAAFVFFPLLIRLFRSRYHLLSHSFLIPLPMSFVFSLSYFPSSCYPNSFPPQNTRILTSFSFSFFKLRYHVQ